MNSALRNLIFICAIAAGLTSLLFATDSQAGAGDCERGCAYVLEVRPYHVDASCLSDEQIGQLEDGFASRKGAVSFFREDIADACIVDQGSAPRGAGVSPFVNPDAPPRGAGVSPFMPCVFGDGAFTNEDRACVLTVLISEGPEGVEQIAIINPDSMHPGCLVSANPTPHP